MKLFIAGMFLMFSAASLAACDEKEAIFLVEEGMMESAANDCRGDGIGLETFTEAYEHFQSIYQRYYCSGDFSKKAMAYLECSAIAEAHACAGNAGILFNCRALL